MSFFLHNDHQDARDDSVAGMLFSPSNLLRTLWMATDPLHE